MFARSVKTYTRIWDPWFLAGFSSLLMMFVHIRFLAGVHKDDEQRVGVLAGIITVLLTSALIVLDLPHHSYIPLFISSTFISFLISYKRITAIVLISVSFTVYSVLLFFVEPGILIITMFGIAVAAIVGRIAIDGMTLAWRKQYTMADQARWAATEFAQANVRLQDSISDTEIRSTTEERNRLAREIHDTVGHSLTGLLAHLRTAREVLKIDAAQVAPILGNLEDMVHTAIGDVRQEVRLIRGREPIRLSWQVRWRQLCRSFTECTGTGVQLNMPEELGLLDNMIGESIYRILQESLTNAIRHGRATNVDITMKQKKRGGKLLIRISDDGKGAAMITTGVGLDGIRERTKALNGAVAWKTMPGKGFDLGVELPMPWGSV